MSSNLRNRRAQAEDTTTSPRVVEVDTDEEVEITRTTEQQRTRNRLEREYKKSNKKYVVKDDADDDDESFHISVLDILRVIVTFIVLSVALSYYVTAGESYIWGFEKQRPWWMRYNGIKQFLQGPINLTPSQLALYDGSDPSLPIYLALNGTIIDVSANPRIYGPGGGYHFFVGTDATRAFVTGCFKEDLTGDMTGVEELYIPIEDADDSHREKSLTPGEKKRRHEREVQEAREKVAAQVDHWVKFYSNHNKYFAVGKVVPEKDQEEVREKKEWKLCESAQQNRPKRSELNKQL
ncbi:heme/steroid binding domain protein, putative [Talaromyces stipitatus ATCC 10500]|uniref:Heme/steroid binding domain protein, putative n=1 Tax=Talaromyces stipitatus (strain ATCC 10500 / CBS 375.48 / QM 6759 / NRRL 1006) TaxID=441959 RepID=B8M0R1_TALSN|nr:heme/steroid binding domain protein, putative [Talaromyces stipitatus ATCC 10500]EED21444.1 heme/steroid binding domain protein, putative [Talaromyces stipitatus ATCC 10500]